ncbi:ATP-dependent Clp protease adaptor ClpS [Marinoscillum furvescens]|uniref:ATP-dependent Clp protease adaptor protein ClpS n=1 Tax=Marinoscillum furvescens DSM 4134 TaxID=1122208 RepID=A0A3D9L5A4_MARFU|nr:ATP-dependent Clp protease adaptor protein ClpS [Marinoscillum furvescens DSM 4134]
MVDMEFAPDIEELVDVEEDLGQEDVKSLIVHNDDFNTFDHVINTLIKVCKHDVHQAEQCTYIIHFKGKCAVKKGSLKELRPMRDGITDAGISATIE